MRNLFNPRVKKLTENFELWETLILGDEAQKREAVAYLFAAAQQRHRRATYFYALCLDQGFFVERDQAKAIEWLETASESDYSFGASGLLGQYYLYGIGVEKDRQKAIRLFYKAAEDDNPCGLFQMSLLPEQKIKELSHPKSRNVMYYTKASMLETAARLKNLEAQAYVFSQRVINNQTELKAADIRSKLLEFAKKGSIVAIQTLISLSKSRKDLKLTSEAQLAGLIALESKPILPWSNAPKLAELYLEAQPEPHPYAAELDAIFPDLAQKNRKPTISADSKISLPAFESKSEQDSDPYKKLRALQNFFKELILTFPPRLEVLPEAERTQEKYTGLEFYKVEFINLAKQGVPEAITTLVKYCRRFDIETDMAESLSALSVTMQGNRRQSEPSLFPSTRSTAKEDYSSQIDAIMSRQKTASSSFSS